MSIPFIQYLRPNGRPVTISIERSPEIEAKAQRIITAGYRFECEQLGVLPPLPDVSLTVSNGEQDVAFELCRNGPNVPAAVDKLIREFPI